MAIREHHCYEPIETLYYGADFESKCINCAAIRAPDFIILCVQKEPISKRHRELAFISPCVCECVSVCFVCVCLSKS